MTSEHEEYRDEIEGEIDDHRFHWEEEAEEAVEHIIGEVEFDNEKGRIRIGEEWLGFKDLESLETHLMEVYDEHWYANVPFESGSAVFQSDPLTYAQERMADEGVYDFFERFAEGRPPRFVLVVAEERDSGILLPQDSVINLQDLGLFTSDEIAEFKELIASPKCRENDLQRFFEEHPHFLSRWDCPGIHSQVWLPRPEKGPLMPDFILCHPKHHKAATVDLKLPLPKLVRRQKNRERWRNPVYEARAQLLRYRDWFDETANREQLHSRVGMEIYKPSLAVVIGRCSEFQNALERQRLVADMPDVEMITYDEIAAWAERRRLV